MLAFVPFPCLAQSFSLSGYVIDGLTNAPLSNVRLHLYEAKDDGPSVPPVAPDLDGHFRFTGLSAGQYSLQAELAKDLVVYGELPDVYGRRLVDVGLPEKDRIVLFRILPRGAISGTVKDEFGDPMESAGISIYRAARQGAHIALLPAGRSATDELGHYNVGELWPGDYVACAEPPVVWPNYFVPQAEGKSEYRPGGDSRVYTRSCHPNPNDQTGRLYLGAGDRLNVDHTLGSSPSFTVRIKGFGNMFREGDGFNVPIRADILALGNGAGEVPNVPPGSYVIEGYGSGINQSATVVRRSVTVAEEAPRPIELVAETRATIEVVFHSIDRRMPDSEAATVSFVPIEPRLRYMPLSKDHSTYALDPGSYWLSVRTKAPYCLASANLAGQTVTQTPIVAAPSMSGRLDLELDTHCGSVQVHTLSDGNPTPIAEVLLLMSGTPQNPGDVITGNADASGLFTIPLIAPGHYSVWAWASSGSGYLGPVLADSAQEAVDVAVAPGQATSTSISVIHGPGVRR
jgi:hypothetical protein